MGIITALQGRRARIGTYAALLVMLVLWLFIFPVLDFGGAGTKLVGEVIFVGLLLVSVGAAAEHPRYMRVLAVLALASVTVSALVHGEIVTASWMAVLGDFVRMAFIALLVLTILRHVLKPEVVSVEDILGAICVYLLLSAVFSLAYRVVLTLDPGAISIADSTATDTGRAPPPSDELSYFSVVTLTTLGYGDVVPRSPWPACS